MTAILLHGIVWLLRQVRFGRVFLDELKIKPRNRFRAGLFVPSRIGRLESGDMFPQAWLRDGAEMTLSDDVFGARFVVVGFGRHPEEFLDPHSVAAWRNAGGQCVQLCHAGQQLHRYNRQAWEDFTGRIVPETATVGSAAIVRPDRTVLHVGPVSESSRLVREALALIAAPPTVSDHTQSNSQIRMSCMTHLSTTQPARHPQPTVKAGALAYLRFERPDLDEAERFLTDFGLRIAERRRDALFFRATGPRPSVMWCSVRQ